MYLLLFLLLRLYGEFMQLIQVFAKNYKGYKSLELNLKTLNILIGKNGSGKSIITRLIPLIIESLNFSRQSPLNLSPVGIDIASTFSDLSFKQRESSTVTLGAAFKGSDFKIKFLTSIIYSSDLKKMLISVFEFTINDEEKIRLELNLDENDETCYLDKNSGQKVRVEFSGLLPLFGSDYFSTLIDKHIEIKLFYEQISFISRNLSYLGPFRRPLRRVYPYRLGVKDIGSEGENAPFIFCNQSNNVSDKLSVRIKGFMESDFGGKYISVRQSEIGFSLVVKNGSSENNIVDDGVGYSQFFPLLVSRLSKLDAVRNTIEIIEQPELHLHPAACGIVADLYFTALNNLSNTIILETHSKELLLRLRRRVAEAETHFQDINIIYTESKSGNCTVNYIKMNQYGELDWWPSGVFEESFEEVIKIREAKDGH
jgi:predicted ATPase